jgi:hypothetical protein
VEDAGLHPIAKAWGLPNWLDGASYGDTEKWGLFQWRWEFSRRREDLRAYFDHWCEPTDVCVDGHGKRPEAEGFSHIDARSKFGYSPLPNPRVSRHNPNLIFPSVGDGLGNYIVGFQPNNRVIGDLLEFVGVDLTDRQAQMLREVLRFRYAPVEENEMLLTFDLDKPLEAQFSHARELLNVYQSERHSKLLQRRKSRDKWPMYLRVLDGRECGASWSEIGAVLRYTDKSPQTARDIWNQARALCFNFPH